MKKKNRSTAQQLFWLEKEILHIQVLLLVVGELFGRFELQFASSGFYTFHIKFTLHYSKFFFFVNRKTYTHIHKERTTKENILTNCKITKKSIQHTTQKRQQRKKWSRKFMWRKNAANAKKNLLLFCYFFLQTISCSLHLWITQTIIKEGTK